MTATWTQPRTWSVGELTTAAWMNQYVRDEFDYLKTPPNSGRVNFAANFVLTAVVYTDITNLTTTITTFGGGLDVILRLQFGNTTPAATSFQILVDGVVAVVLGNANPTTANLETCFVDHIAAIAAGSHIIKVQGKVVSGTTTIIGTTAATGDPLFYVREAAN